ncbi:hypothetical protein JQX30_27755 [Saccharopolyspora erythraea]|nr:hypothetical protein JQX30_27755 [Saccharopolyspora erythraea]
MPGGHRASLQIGRFDNAVALAWWCRVRSGDVPSGELRGGIGRNGVVPRTERDSLSVAERDRLDLPAYAKPTRNGSSVGVSRVDPRPSLPASVASTS